MDWQLEEEYRQNSFGDAVKRIAQVRKANPRFDLPLDLPTIAVELENYTVERLKSVPGGDQWITPGEAPPLPFQKRLRTQGFGDVAAAGLEFAKNAVAGIGLWISYFGSSGPVSSSLAESRATVCSTCEFNGPLTGLNALSKEAGEDLSLILGSLHQKKLTTKHNAKLDGCRICTCPLRAKCWVPLDLVVKHTRKEVMEKLPPYCWQIKEQNAKA